MTDNITEEEKKVLISMLGKLYITSNSDAEKLPSANDLPARSSKVPALTFSLNPDAFSGQIPQTEEEKAALRSDENDVRMVGAYLREAVIPELLNDLRQSASSFPLDGRALSTLVHKRGINVRYIGKQMKKIVCVP